MSLLLVYQRPMTKTFKFSVMLIALYLFAAQISMSETIPSLEYAKSLYRHELTEKSKEAFIKILYSPKSSEDDKAESLYWLGHISFQEEKYSVAFEDWNELIENYPNNPLSDEISTQFSYFREIFPLTPVPSDIPAVARSYIRNGDFWIKQGQEEININFAKNFSEEAKMDIAMKWYKLAIKEYPNTRAAEYAYQQVFFILIKLPDPLLDIYKSTKESIDSLKKSISTQDMFSNIYRNTNIEQLKNHEKVLRETRKEIRKLLALPLSEFSKYELSFPNSPNLDTFCYMIAQIYFIIDEQEMAEEFIDKIETKDDRRSSFYKESLLIGRNRQ